MSYTDADVERVAEAIWESTERALVSRHVLTEDAMEPWEDATDMHDEYRQHARAALEAMEREPLEDVLRTCLDALDRPWEHDIRLSRHHENEHTWCAAIMNDATHFEDQMLIAEGTGATIDEAIRNAVAAAKGDE